MTILDLLNQHVAILGKTGSGKTYAAKGLVESLLDAGRQACIIDPTGAWYGLRLAANGKGDGYPVVILGGEHGDIPLSERSGSAVARLVTEQLASIVIDTSGMTVGEYTRWFIDFAGTLYTTIRNPLHLIIDEAHYFMPQSGSKMSPDTAKMLHAGNRLISGGRSKGIRAMMLTQRPAKLHKDSLTCADTLIAMRVIAPQDRGAIKEWVDGCGNAADGRGVLESLATLQRGEGWVWYPEGGLLERRKFPKIKTYDSSSTPTHGAAKAPELGSIDLGAVKASMEEAVREAEANDPKILRARIAELERAAKSPDDSKQASRLAGMEHRCRELEAAVREAERAGMSRTMALLATPLRDAGSVAVALSSLVPRLTVQIETLTIALGAIPTMLEKFPPPTPNGKAHHPPAPKAARPTPALRADEGAGLGGPERDCLAAFAWFASIGVDEPDKAQLCFRLGWRITSGHIKNVLGRLRTAGLVDGLRLTPEGRAAAAWPTAPASLAEYHGQLRECLDGPQRLVFDLLLRGEMGRDEICNALGWSTASGHIKNVIGALRTLGVVERRGWKLSPLVYPEGLA